MGYKTVELTLMSAKDLKNVNLIGKMDVYVVVFLSSDPRSKQKTPVHQDGGTSPRWNHTVQFTVDDSAPGLMVVFQLKHQHTFGFDKDLGEVRIAVKDLIAAFRNTKDAQIATYQVRRPSGKPKGELKLSYKVNDVVYGRNQQQAPVTAYPLQPSSSVYPPPPPPTAYPAPPPVTRYPPQASPYPPPPPYGYGYPVQMQQQPQRVRRNGGLGMGMGAGLLGGALGGLLIGDLISDSYGGGGYGGGGYDGGGYDGGGYDGGGFDGGDMDF